MAQPAETLNLPVPALPPRDAIAQRLMADEEAVVRELIDRARLDHASKQEVEALARRLVHAVRAGRRETGGIDAFMQEYSLSSEEGVVLMCLAEALLRVPDAATADKLIADKIGGGQWEEHFGHSESLFVNASTWGLMLTGRVIKLGDEPKRDLFGYFNRLVARSGEPFIRQALRHAMKIMGRQFVLGRSIEEALDIARESEAVGYRFSYDMLGEAAMTDEDARAYLDSYMHALKTTADKAGPMKPGETVFERPNISVKLSALHPRYEPKKIDRMETELYQRVLAVCEMARGRDLGITIDAEEVFRLDLSLDLFGRLAQEPALAGWDGLGLAVQAYGKRAYPVLEWLAELAQVTHRRLPVRLVKGAYWDSEIKLAQEGGFDAYPVFTRKVSTDISYLACARFMLSRLDVFYPQFATHNAHTLAAVMVMAGDRRGFEFQRLHGMGQALYDEVVGGNKLDMPCRIYAPVGTHEDLLAYLVRRLLENGANTSFVHRLANDEAPIRDIIADPVEEAERLKVLPHPGIPLPKDIFSPRRNSHGLPLWDDTTRGAFLKDVHGALERGVSAAAMVAGKPVAGEARTVVSPHDNRVEVGTVVEAGEEAVEQALARAHAARHDWDMIGGAERAAILERAADLYETETARLVAIIVREAGKSLENAIADLREAVDFLRYYAARARAEFAGPVIMPGPTGERNEMRLHGRGVFVCISPWNFPLAIFTGQMSAALAAGNTVIAKPAEQTPLIAVEAVKLLYKAGVPEDVLHVLPGDGATVGGRLIADPRCAGVAFTGSNETAGIINRTLAEREGAIIPFIAETGGINAMIVDSTALPEQVVRDLVFSAFDSAGQRCSAARVAFVQKDVAHRVLPMLKGAMEELKVGDPLDYATDVGPVIDREALKMLNEHKSRMAREGRILADLELGADTRYGTFVSPAAYEIESLSMLKREVFGPVLHVVQYSADRLEEVCEVINATGFGLTLGLHTRIERTVEEVRRVMRVGNMYVNRNQIGAVVGAQPFGGEGLSGTGPKAGGPHYLYRFATERVTSVDTTASGGNASLFTMAAQED
ncbi:bifunctional proline dehydrogenase/L-glutamate gamma-semialdehyde dehydrogenase PutA [Kaustia mangrovi]|uniref:Bifunctional protein PutA n=1 Tax=Kaustia mangrovi TaxID=2593653 RepID=A0A7S8HB03_9HYPH|nr:bifunctional proline dehydrogenase/L-glutamate gamma-semialdehyde dehydrogenase PutA [Kaustia mangrovi]QPC41638.1 bifunctional proline dehydrogenase/L-glutamate gamma-semialdehyde dehydrogenase PutA [Kaustia mangrovi]